MNRRERIGFARCPNAIINALIMRRGLPATGSGGAIINALITRHRRRLEPLGRCAFKHHK
jgi:hypothetical protein